MLGSFLIFSSLIFAQAPTEWLPLDTKPNKYELDINSLRYIDSSKKYIDVRYRLMIGGADNQYSVSNSAITCTDMTAGQEYLWEKFSGNGDKLDVRRTFQSALLASKKLADIVSSGYGSDEIKLICQYAWKNENAIKGFASTAAEKNISKKINTENSQTLLLENTKKPTSSNTRIIVNKNPLPFSFVMPASWTEGLIVSGNTKFSIKSPKEKSEAECAVLAIEMKGLSATQQQINQNMYELPSKKEIENELAANWKNVKVDSMVKSNINGYIAQQVIFQHGSNETGWAIASSTTAVIAPNITFSVICGGTGSDLVAAKKSFDYWRSEINIFPTTIRFFKR